MDRKVIQISRVLNVLLKVFIVLSLYAYFLGVLWYFTGEGTFSLSDASMPIYFSFRQELPDTAQSLQIKENIAFVVGIPMAICSLSIYYIASSIFKDISKEKSPFDLHQVRRLKRIAYLYLANFLLFTFLPNILYFFFIEGVYYQFVLDGSLILNTVIFLVMAAIFAYGAELQQSADETL